MERRFLDVDGVSKYLTISKSCIYKKVVANEIPYHKIGGRTIFDIEEINTWVKSDGTINESTKLVYNEFKSFLD
jgi:excisionase family DNA binding protein